MFVRMLMVQYMLFPPGSSAIQSPHMVVYATFTPLYLFENKIFTLEKMVRIQNQEIPCLYVWWGGTWLLD